MVFCLTLSTAMYMWTFMYYTAFEGGRQVNRNARQ